MLVNNTLMIIVSGPGAVSVILCHCVRVVERGDFLTQVFGELGYNLVRYSINSYDQYYNVS